MNVGIESKKEIEEETGLSSEIFVFKIIARKKIRYSAHNRKYLVVSTTGLHYHNYLYVIEMCVVDMTQLY